MKNENIYSIDKLNQYLTFLNETLVKKQEEINQLQQNYSNIEKETQRREQNLREFIMHLNVKAYNRDFHLIRKNMKQLGFEINENINTSYYNGKSKILTHMHSVSSKNDVLLKESFYTHQKLLDNIEKQQGSTMVLFNKNYDNNNKLKENYSLVKRKCELFIDKVTELKDAINAKRVINIELFYSIYTINRLLTTLKNECGVMNGDYNFNLLHGNLIDLNLKNEYKLNKTNTHFHAKLSKESNGNHDTHNKEIKNNILTSLPKSFDLNSIKSFTKAKQINKILSNLLNILEYKKQINKKLVQSKKVNSNLYLKSVFNLIEKSKNEMMFFEKEKNYNNMLIENNPLKTLNSSMQRKSTYLNYYFISKNERIRLINNISANFEDKN